MRAATSGRSERAVRRLAPPAGKARSCRRQLGAGPGVALRAREQLQLPEGIARDELRQGRAVLGGEDDHRARGDDVEPIARDPRPRRSTAPALESEELGFLGEEVQLALVEGREERGRAENIGRAWESRASFVAAFRLFHGLIVARV